MMPKSSLELRDRSNTNTLCERSHSCKLVIEYEAFRNWSITDISRQEMYMFERLKTLIGKSLDYGNLSQIDPCTAGEWPFHGNWAYVQTLCNWGTTNFFEHWWVTTILLQKINCERPNGTGIWQTWTTTTFTCQSLMNWNTTHLCL